MLTRKNYKCKKIRIITNDVHWEHQFRCDQLWVIGSWKNKSKNIDKTSTESQLHEQEVTLQWCHLVLESEIVHLGETKEKGWMSSQSTYFILPLSRLTTRRYTEKMNNIAFICHLCLVHSRWCGCGHVGSRRRGYFLCIRILEEQSTTHFAVCASKHLGSVLYWQMDQEGRIVW